MTVRSRILAAVAMVGTAVACKPAATVGSPGTTVSPAASRAPALPAGVTDAAIAEGKTLYETATNNCVRCHGADAKGTTRGPDLTDSIWVHSDGMPAGIARTITTGVPASAQKGNYQFPMAPKGRANHLTEMQVQSIAAYIWSVSHKR